MGVAHHWRLQPLVIFVSANGVFRQTVSVQSHWHYMRPQTFKVVTTATRQQVKRIVLILWTTLYLPQCIWFCLLFSVHLFHYENHVCVFFVLWCHLSESIAVKLKHCEEMSTVLKSFPWQPSNGKSSPLTGERFDSDASWTCFKSYCWVRVAQRHLIVFMKPSADEKWL